MAPSWLATSLGPLLLLAALAARAAHATPSASVISFLAGGRRDLVARAVPRLLTAALWTDDNPPGIKYNGGRILKATISVNIIWYGKLWTPQQKAIIVDGINSLGNTPNGKRSPEGAPSMTDWWAITKKYTELPTSERVSSRISVTAQFVDPGSQGATIGEPEIQAIVLNALKCKAFAPAQSAAQLVIISSDIASPIGQSCGGGGNLQYKGVDVVYGYVGDSSAAGNLCALQHVPDSPFYVGPPPNGDIAADSTTLLAVGALASLATNPDATSGPPGWVNPVDLASAFSYCFYQFGATFTDTGGRTFTHYGTNGRVFVISELFSFTSYACASVCPST